MEWKHKLLLLGLACGPLACFSPAESPVAQTAGDTGSSSGEPTGDAASAETTLLVTGEGSGDSSTSTSSGLDSTGPSGSSTSADTVDTGDTGDSTTGEPGSSWQLYSRFLNGPAWSVVDLDDVWTGPSAPPTDGILATVRLTHFNRFLVFSEDGYTYQQVDGTWIDPVLTDDLFPIVGDRVIDAVSHLPAQFDPTIETLFIAADSHAILYQMYGNGSVAFVQDVALIDEPDGPPHVTGQLRWGFTITNLADGSPDWVRWYEHYNDDEIYLANGTGTWVDHFPVLDNDYFMGAPGEPDPRQAIATWHDDSTGRLHVIAP